MSCPAVIKKLQIKVHPAACHEGPEKGVELYLYSFFNLGAR
jgi:hypothetical protein